MIIKVKHWYFVKTLLVRRRSRNVITTCSKIKIMAPFLVVSFLFVHSSVELFLLLVS